MKTEGGKKCRRCEFVTCRRQQKVSKIFTFSAEKVAHAGQLWGCPDESERNNARHHGCMNRRARLGGNADTQDIELWWHLHRSAFQKTALSPRQNWDTRINIHTDCRPTEQESQRSQFEKEMFWSTKRQNKRKLQKGIQKPCSRISRRV